MCVSDYLNKGEKKRKGDGFTEGGWGGIVVVVLCCLFRRFFVFCLTKKRDISLRGSRRDEKCRESVSGVRFLLFVIGKQLFFCGCEGLLLIYANYLF